MKKGTIELNANGQPRKRRKDGEYIYRPGRPVSNPGKPMTFRLNIDLVPWLDGQENKSEYINELIRNDIEKKCLKDEYENWANGTNEED